MIFPLHPKSYIIVLAAVFMIAPNAVSQKKPSKNLGSIAGTVTDEESRKPIVGAVITVAGSKFAAHTDPHGNYRFSLPKGYAKLVFSMIG